MDYRKLFGVRPGRKLHLADFDTAPHPGVKDKPRSQALLDANIARLDDLQYRLYAEGKRSLLAVFQAMDAGGKDGVIRKVMSGVNPQGCHVTSFKAPSTEELAHDFLWRIHRRLPARGQIGIFNRSHYEDVLIVRVHNLVPKAVWSKRYQQINGFEKMLAGSGTTTVKFFLHISKTEQLERFRKRLAEPEKHWKFEPQDLKEREHWDDYMSAYQDAICRCCGPHAPWYVIPADHKWFRDLAVSEILVRTLDEMNPKFPKPTYKPGQIML